jgi:acetyl esterase
LEIIFEDLRFLNSSSTSADLLKNSSDSNYKNVPLVIFFHGGGMVLGEAPDPTGTFMMLEIGEPCIVAHVDYRKSPEHPFPASAEDGFLALKYFADPIRASQFGYDENRIVLLGFSAGGHLVVSVAALARERGLTPKIFLQIPIIPMLHINGTGQSVIESKENGILTLDLLHWFWHMFTVNHENPSSCATDIRCSPLSAIKDFGGLPPAIVLTATGDVMRDDGRTYVKQLDQAGVPVQHLEVIASHSGLFFADQQPLYNVVRSTLFGNKTIKYFS